MPTTPKNSNKGWSANDEADLRKMVRQNTPTRIVALKLDRSPGAVYNKASDMGVSLKPTNQSPYNRRKS